MQHSLRLFGFGDDYRIRSRENQGLVATFDPANQKRRRALGSMRFENDGPPGGAAFRAAF